MSKNFSKAKGFCMSNSNKKIPTSISLTEIELEFVKEMDPAGLTHYIRRKITDDMTNIKTKNDLSVAFRDEYVRHTSALASSILLISIGIAFALIGYLLFIVLLNEYLLVLFAIGIVLCVIGSIQTYRFKRSIDIRIDVEKR